MRKSALELIFLFLGTAKPSCLFSSYLSLSLSLFSPVPFFFASLQHLCTRSRYCRALVQLDGPCRFTLSLALYAPKAIAVAAVNHATRLPKVWLWLPAVLEIMASSGAVALTCAATNALYSVLCCSSYLYIILRET